MAVAGSSAASRSGFRAFLAWPTGLATAAMALFGYTRPRIRHLETELPDQVGEAAAPAPA